MTKFLPTMTSEEFLAARGTRCPNCRSTRTNEGILNPDTDSDISNFVWAKVECEDCESNWEHNYRRETYSNLTVPDGQ
jgi:hypothetical protein